ncbi:hypothetical protein ACWDSF_06500 [Nocardia beijingensis]
MRIRIALISLAAAAALPMTATAHAAPWPGWTDGQQMEVRLLIGGVNREFQRDIIASAHGACDVLRADGKATALGYLGDRGYFEGYQRGYTLGVMVDVTCPELLAAIR